jgi:hypothetical protein
VTVAPADASAATSSGLTPTWRVRINMVVGRVLFGVLYRVEFGEPMDLVAEPASTGRQRLAAATDHVRAALATHVRESQQRHRAFLPEDDVSRVGAPEV